MYQYVECISRVKHLFKKTKDEMESTKKYTMISKVFRKYYESVGVNNICDGFLYSLIELTKFESTLLNVESSRLAILSMKVFKDYFMQLNASDQNVVAEAMLKNDTIFTEALKVVSRFKPKYLGMTAKIFRLTDPNRQKRLLALIKYLLANSEIVRATEWIIFFNLRDQFNSDFEKITCHLILVNQIPLMEKFVGSKSYRQRYLIKYLDKIIEFNFKRVRGRNEAEDFLISIIKRVERLTNDYIKSYNIPETEAPFLLRTRSRSALLFHHYRWKRNEITLTSYEEIALHAIANDVFLRDFYLDFLCRQNLHRNAIYFALQLKLEHFPDRLTTFIAQNEDDFEAIRRDVEVKQNLKSKWTQRGSGVFTSEEESGDENQ